MNLSVEVPSLHRGREIGNLLPNNRHQRRTCYALCHILYPVSAALASFFRMDSISTSLHRGTSLRRTQALSGSYSRTLTRALSEPVVNLSVEVPSLHSFQGFLAQKNPRPCRTLQKDFA